MKVPFTETGKTVVLEGREQKFMGHLKSLPSCGPARPGRQIIRKSLHNVDSTAIMLSAREQAWGKVTGVGGEGGGGPQGSGGG